LTKAWAKALLSAEPLMDHTDSMQGFRPVERAAGPASSERLSVD
jgi:hypothetical protein